MSTDLTWFKSSYSSPQGDPSRPHLGLTPSAWTTFVAQAAARVD
ncbi:DUF397 domain-containing protein [Streptomyces sporangiiformans]|uniref:DUF397 domain-containing protein n=1 Tax=Streptomyces sporangiiformans TaxID=2315329 RepID=A0A505DK93_9ACTN|nr:DUF397 domain-containing protein [Streptomyces sporangiiformans]TPQ20146.1 DUF397 domain-containing protein [Streptomyces sporangiiformans]